MDQLPAVPAWTPFSDYLREGEVIEWYGRQTHRNWTRFERALVVAAGITLAALPAIVGFGVFRIAVPLAEGGMPVLPTVLALVAAVFLGVAIAEAWASRQAYHYFRTPTGHYAVTNLRVLSISEKPMPMNSRDRQVLALQVPGADSEYHLLKSQELSKLPCVRLERVHSDGVGSIYFYEMPSDWREQVQKARSPESVWFINVSDAQAVRDLVERLRATPTP